MKSIIHHHHKIFIRKVFRSVIYFLTTTTTMLVLSTQVTFATPSPGGCFLTGSATYMMNVDIGDISPSIKTGDPITSQITYSTVDVAYCQPTYVDHIETELTATGQQMGGTYDNYLAFKTNVEGIGIELGEVANIIPQKGDTTTYNDWIKIINPLYHDTVIKYNTNQQQVGNVTMAPQIRLVKIGPTISGGTLSGEVGTFQVWSTGSPISPPVPLTVVLMINGEVHASGCEVDSGQDLNITLDDVQKTDLSSIGSTWGQSSPEEIQLTCNQGSNVYITFSGTQASDSNDASILANNGTAKGLGVQLLNEQGEPYTLGERVAAVTNSGTTATIPVSARYIRTGDLGSGSVESSATYTLDYE